MTDAPSTLRIRYNGTDRTVPQGAALADVLSQEGIAPETGGVAAAVNERVVPRREWATRALVEGDRVEVVTASVGG